MKFLRLALVTALVALTAAPNYALASEGDVTADGPLTTKFPVGRSSGFIQLGSAGWEQIANGTFTLTGSNQVLASAFRPGFTAIRFNAFCTFTGGVSGRYIFYVIEKDDDGNILQDANSTGGDSLVDTTAILTGNATTPVVLDVGGYYADNASSGTTRSFARRGHLPPPYFGVWAITAGLTTSSCRWFLYGWRG